MPTWEWLTMSRIITREFDSIQKYGKRHRCSDNVAAGKRQCRDISIQAPFADEQRLLAMAAAKDGYQLESTTKGDSGRRLHNFSS